jgi:GNAT superfamily N-acetyltransferase
LIPAGYEVSTDPARLDRDLIHRFLSEESYWARGRERWRTERSIDDSLTFGVYRGAEQVAYARVVTDRVTFAWLADVFVIREDRGRGIGIALVQAVLEHPDLRDVRRWLLGTKDAHELYRRFGFREVDAGRWMVRDAVQ